MTKGTKCRICGNLLPVAEALVCSECNSSQTATEEWLARHPRWVASFKFIGGAVLVPLLLLLVSAFYSDLQGRREATAATYFEVTNALGSLGTARRALYQDCLGGVEDCTARINLAIATYEAAVQDSRAVILRRIPELFPTVQVLRSLDVGREVSAVWSEYFACRKQGRTHVSCDELRAQVPLGSLEVAEFLSEFLNCKAGEVLIPEKLDSFCNTIIEVRAPVALEWPTEILNEFEGLRLPDQIFEVENEIWCGYLVPGMNLAQSGCDSIPPPES